MVLRKVGRYQMGNHKLKIEGQTIQSRQRPKWKGQQSGIYTIYATEVSKKELCVFLIG